MELTKSLEEKRPTKLKVIYVGSRKSQLALIQTNYVVTKLKEFYENNPDQLEQIGGHHSQECGSSSKEALHFEIVKKSTTGDKVLDKPLPAIGAKSLFTRELEDALLQGEVDIIVHSLKDLPTILPEGCSIGAILKRDSPEDAIVLKKSLMNQVKPLDFLFGRDPKNEEIKFKVGTSSQRRIAMIKRCNPNLECIDIRGNLNTRLSKLDRDDGEYDAIVLAKAGLDRMEWSNRASSLLTPESDQELINWCYAVGQGALAVECKSNDRYILDLLKPIADLKTTYEAISERCLMRKLEGGCSVPLGVRSSWTTTAEGVEILNLDGVVLSADGKELVKAEGKAALLKINEKTIFETPEIDPQTTGIVLPESILLSTNARYNMTQCSKLGEEVANKMIDLGCLRLMNK